MRTFFSTIFMLLIASPVFAQTSDEAKAYQKRMFEGLEKQQLLVKLLNIANDKKLTRDLELLEDQIDELKKIGTEVQRMFADPELQGKSLKAQRMFTDGDQQEALKLLEEYQQEMFNKCDEHMASLKEILLPHQYHRIQQITRQQTLQYQSEFRDEFGIAYALADRVGLSKAEKKKLKAAIKDAREEYYDEIKKLKQKAHDKILASMPAEKRDEIKKIVGEWYEDHK